MSLNPFRIFSVDPYATYQGPVGQSLPLVDGERTSALYMFLNPSCFSADSILLVCGTRAQAAAVMASSQGDLKLNGFSSRAFYPTGRAVAISFSALGTQHTVKKAAKGSSDYAQQFHASGRVHATLVGQMTCLVHQWTVEIVDCSAMSILGPVSFTWEYTQLWGFFLGVFLSS